MEKKSLTQNPFFNSVGIKPMHIIHLSDIDFFFKKEYAIFAHFITVHHN